VRFEQKLGIIATLRQGRLAPEARKRYAAMIQAAGEDENPNVAITEDDILRYELKQLLGIR